MSDRKDTASSMTAITLIGVFGIAGYTVLAGLLGAGFAIPIAVIGLASSAVILRGPVGKALARRLEGGTASPDSEQALMESTSCASGWWSWKSGWTSRNACWPRGGRAPN